MTHPDFELYDNIGRTAEQIAAAHFGVATRDDLLRWARRDAKRFLAEHPLPSAPLPAPDAAPYLAALAEAKTPAEVSAVTRHLLDAAEPVLVMVSDLLVSIARWDNRHRSPETPGTAHRQLMEAASRSLSVLGLTEEADLGFLRAEYDPAPTPSKPGGDLPPAPPAPPSAGHTPGR